MARRIIVTAEAEPARHTFADLAVGDSCIETLRISQEMVEKFISVSGDSAPVHCDDVFARKMNYPGRVVHGLLVTLRFSRLLGMFMPGALSIIHSTRFDYRQPVGIGDKLTYSVTVARLSEAARIALLDLETRRDGEICVKGVAQCVLTR